jgi:hypothetical protein
MTMLIALMLPILTAHNEWITRCTDLASTSSTSGLLLPDTLRSFVEKTN